MFADRVAVTELLGFLAYLDSEDREERRQDLEWWCVCHRRVDCSLLMEFLKDLAASDERD